MNFSGRVKIPILQNSLRCRLHLSGIFAQKLYKVEVSILDQKNQKNEKSRRGGLKKIDKIHQISLRTLANLVEDHQRLEF